MYRFQLLMIVGMAALLLNADIVAGNAARQ